jgi:putative glutamine amidotransferase
MRPRIGITTSTLERAPEGAIAVSTATHLSYARCVYEAGGLPLLLPNLPATDADEVLSHLDGLLLSGGGDVDPAHWGEAPHDKLGLIDPVRDTYEMALVQAALRRDLPMLGICRGVQVMAVAAGGSLWQDIPSQCADSLPHAQSAPRDVASHTVEVEADSLLARVLDPDAKQTFYISVNSFHHQAPRACGTIWQPVAHSSDGLIEALVAPEASFALGVQWHPEEMTLSAPAHARLFAALTAAARARMGA